MFEKHQFFTRKKLEIVRKNNFAEGFKIFAGYKSKNNFVGILKIMSNAAKNFDILVTSFT